MTGEAAYLGDLHDDDASSPTAALAYWAVLWGLGAVMFSRVFVAAGLPAMVNFVHFPLVIAAAMMVLPRSRNRQVSTLLAGMACLGAAMAISALLNGAGIINVILDLVLLGEPMFLLLLMVDAPWPRDWMDRLRRWILGFLCLHVLAAWYQWLILGWRGDDVKGVFLNQIAGHHVGGGVALIGAVYFAIEWRGRSWEARWAFATLAAGVTVLADAKQVIAAALGALLVLAAYGTRQPGRSMRYLLLAAVATGIVAIAAMTVFPALRTWADADLVWTGIRHKVSVFRILSERQPGVWQALFGLGPGHTIGRLGWMLPDYLECLGPLGATTSPVTQAIRDANDAHWLSASSGSSMWSLLFSWAGIWGDLGILGMGIYGLLWVWVWRSVCRTDLSRFLLLNLLGLGCVYAWLEEPAYALLVMSLIGVGGRGNANPVRA